MLRKLVVRAKVPWKDFGRVFWKVTCQSQPSWGWSVDPWPFFGVRHPCRKEKQQLGMVMLCQNLIVIILTCMLPLTTFKVKKQKLLFRRGYQQFDGNHADRAKEVAHRNLLARKRSKKVGTILHVSRYWERNWEVCWRQECRRRCLATYWHPHFWRKQICWAEGYLSEDKGTSSGSLQLHFFLWECCSVMCRQE